MTPVIGIGIGIGFGQRTVSVAVPDMYPDPPWADNLTDASSLGWQQFGNETNVGTFGVNGFELTVADGNNAFLSPFGAIVEYGQATLNADAVIQGTITPGVGATGFLQVFRADFSGNGYGAQLHVNSTNKYVTLSRLLGGVGTVIVSQEIDNAVAWGGIWLKTDTVGNDTRLRVFLLHSDGTWRAIFDVTDPDTADVDIQGYPSVGMASLGGSTDFVLSFYEGTYDAGKVYNETVLMESSFTGPAGSIDGQPADTTGTGAFAVTLGSVNRNGTGRLVAGNVGNNNTLYDVGSTHNRVDGQVNLSSINNQDRLGLIIAAGNNGNLWLAYYNRRNAINKFTIIERINDYPIVRAGSGNLLGLGAVTANMWVEITSDGFSIMANIQGYPVLTYSPGFTLTRYGTFVGLKLDPLIMLTNNVGFNYVKVT